MKLNKSSPADRLSLLFQTSYSGRAEIGLLQDDDLQVKVSSDGNNFETALNVKSDSGYIGVGIDEPLSRLHIRQDFDARMTIETGTAGAGGGFDISNPSDNSQWRVTGSFANFKIRDHSASLDKLVLEPEANGDAYLINTTAFGIGTSAPTTKLHINGPARIGQYSKSGLPSATSVGAGTLIYVSDASGGGIPAFSDGSSWRRVDSRAIVS